MQDLHVDSTARIAWLLITLRQHSGLEHLSPRKDFAAALVRLGVNADPSRVSRWESGSQYAPERVLHGYGELLGYPPGHLTSVAQNLRCALDPGAPPGVLLIKDVPSTDRELNDLFAGIEAGEHDGTDWTRLAASLTEGTPMFLPEKMWASLSERILNEAVRSTGIAHIRRTAASAVFARHAPSQRVMIQSVGRLVTLPGPRFVGPAMMLLRAVDTAQVDGLLLQMFESSPPLIRRGAAAVITSKLARNNFDEQTRDRIAGILTTEFAALRGRVFPTDRVGVLATLDRMRQKRVLAALPEAVDSVRLEELISTGLSVPMETSHRIGVQVARRVVALEGRSGSLPEPDRMLIRLIEEALFHIHRERRHQAICLLGVSPFCRSLPTALLQVIDASDPYVAARCMSLIAFLRPEPSIAGQLLTWAFHHPNHQLRARAMIALVPLGRSLTDATLDEIAALASASSVRATLVTAAHLLGSIGPHAGARLAGTSDAEAAAIVEWWRVSGPAIAEDVLTP